MTEKYTSLFDKIEQAGGLKFSTTILLAITANTETERQLWVRDISGVLSDLCGGTTVVSTLGRYKNQEEVADFIMASCTAPEDYVLGELLMHLYSYLASAKQEALYIIVNGKAMLIDYQTLRNLIFDKKETVNYRRQV